MKCGLSEIKDVKMIDDKIIVVFKLKEEELEISEEDLGEEVDGRLTRGNLGLNRLKEIIKEIREDELTTGIKISERIWETIEQQEDEVAEILKGIRKNKGVVYKGFKEYIAENIIPKCKDDICKKAILTYCKEQGISKEMTEIIMQSDIHIANLCRKYLGEVERYDRENILRVWVETCKIFYNMFNGKKAELKKLIGGRKEMVSFVTTLTGERQATLEEIESKEKGVYRKTKYYIDREKCKKLCLVGWAITGEKGLLNESLVEKKKTDKEQLIKVLNVLYFATQWIQSDDFEEEKKRLELGVKGTVYSSNKDLKDEDANIITLIEYIINNHKEDEKDNFINFGFTIATQAIERKKYELTTKQINVLWAVFKSMKGIEKKSYGEYSDEIEAKCNEILDNTKIPQSEFVLKVVSTVLKYKRATQKQVNIINDGYVRVIKGKEEIEKKDGKEITEEDINNVFSMDRGDRESAKLSDIDAIFEKSRKRVGMIPCNSNNVEEDIEDVEDGVMDMDTIFAAYN